MFDNKKSSLFDVPVKVKGSNVNAFVQGALTDSAKTKSNNGATKCKTTGQDFVDQFGSVGQYLSPRDFKSISLDMQTLYGQDSLTAIKFTLYLRLISRKCKLFDGSTTNTVQKGVGLKHESIMRMVWLAINQEKVFWQNIQLFITVGSWKDIFEMMRIDLEFHGFTEKVLNWNALANLIIAGLENPETSELVKKYLPQITSKSKCVTIRKQANTIIGKFLSNKILGKNSYKEYRKLKSSGTAHIWQQLISKRLFNEVDFDSIHGRALSSLVSSKFLENNKLEEKYTEWIESKPVAKFTGYVHELAQNIKAPNMCGRRGTTTVSLTPYQKMTINKQFDGLVKLAKEGVNTNTGLIVVRDTSASMTSNIIGRNISSYDVAKSLGIFFGSMLEGHFSKSWIEFADGAKMHRLKGETFVDNWLGDSSETYGSTNFQAVIDLFLKLKAQGVTEDQFPTGILCISDGEFNSIGNVTSTNFEHARARLRNGGFSTKYCEDFKFVMWDIPNNFYSRDSGTKFETFGETNNVFYLSGYDASILTFLLGGKGSEDLNAPQTDVELFNTAMNQEILNLVTN